MTDLERFVALYKDFGINCIVTKLADGTSRIRLTDGRGFEGATESDKFDGYGMFTDIEFDKEGKFVSQGFWE